MLKTKRIYEAPSQEDGYRVLVDRLWPRGVSKQDAHIDVWLKDVAPSSELRTWFGHDPQKFAEFRHRYNQELKHNPAVIELRHIVGQHDTVTLLYGAKDMQANQATVLQDFLGYS